MDTERTLSYEAKKPHLRHSNALAVISILIALVPAIGILLAILGEGEGMAALALVGIGTLISPLNLIFSLFLCYVLSSPAIGGSRFV